ncbi:hypothetical protein CCZ01_09470 [Helicobacter monodelphidis]|uniref:plasmid mobilization protein n=1 Tax=Helicobacter sp. 15-1451 TaxID=2004995 RepID=UPI000DCE4380|nr:DNA transfer protein [Helicobacter sp. 15-1451]RAX56456.1 hypothetical protein CCZ01_09470 [Helicobacter sp. 15-1451]
MEIRNKIISLRITEEEAEILKEKATQHSLSVSSYLRKLGLNNPVHSTIDQQAVRDILNVSGDLGRLGGLFKKWLIDNAKIESNLGNRTYSDVEEIVNDILKLQNELREKAKKLL